MSLPGRQRLSKTVVALGFVSLFTDIASEMVYTQVPIFLTQVLGARAEIVGLIEGLAESTASLLRILSGRISDRIGRRKPLTILGYGFGAISKPLLFLATSWPIVLGLRFLDRVGKGLRTAPRDALIAEETSLELRGRAFGLHRAMDTTGAVLGPLLGLWFLQRYHAPKAMQLRALFLFAGLPGIVAVLVLLLFVRERPASGQNSPHLPTARSAAAESGAAPAARQPLSRDYRRFLAIVFLFGLGNSSDAFLILRANQLGFDSSMLMWLYAAFNVVEAALGYAAGILSDRIGRRPLIVTGYVIFAIVYLGFGVTTKSTSVFVWPLFLLYGGYYTLTQGSQRALAADFANPERLGAEIGAYHAVVGIALLPASLVAGALYHWNPAAPFLLGSATALLATVLLARLPKRRGPAG